MKSIFSSILIFFAFVSCTKKEEVEFKTPNYQGIEIPKTIQKDLKVGDGAQAELGKTVKINFTGWIYDPAKPGNRGDKFTESGAEPTRVDLGGGDVVKGWEQGIVGMRVDGKRQLIIPASEAYGKNGAGNRIPPDAILLIEMVLLEVQN